MRVACLALVAVMAFGLGAREAADGQPASSTTTSAACTREVATAELDRRGLLPRDQNFEGAAVVVCRDFTNDGLTDMAFGRESGGSAYTIGWGIFSARRHGGWKLAVFKPRRAEVRIKPAGNDLLRGAWRYRRSDAHCCPTGGFAVHRYSYDAATGRFERVGISLRQTAPAGFR